MSNLVSHLVAAMIIAAGTIHLRYLILATAPISADLEFGYQVNAPGVGTLFWGATDFIPARRPLIALAVVSLPAAACLWLLDDPAVGVLFLSLVRGGLIRLP